MRLSYLQVSIESIPIGYLLAGNSWMQYAMDKFDQRRADLRRLTDSFGRGGIAHVAEKIGKDASYVSRMLSDPEKRGHKKIGEDSVDALTESFPEWQGKESVCEESSAVTDIASRRTIDTVDNALRVLADAINRLEPDNRDGVAGLLSSFGRNPSAPGTYAALLALLDSGNARRQVDPPPKSSISGGR